MKKIILVVLLLVPALVILLQQKDVKQTPIATTPVQQSSNQLSLTTNNEVKEALTVQPKDSMNISSPEWEKQVRAFGFDPDLVAQQEKANSQPTNSSEEENIINMISSVSKLINSQTHESFDEKQRITVLKDFIAAVDPAINELQKSMESVDRQNISSLDKDAYIANANHRITALSDLRDQALSTYPGLED